MSFTDLTGGAGYAFGARWPSAHATHLMTDHPDAVDGRGGTYTLTAGLTINEGGGPYTVTIDRLSVNDLTANFTAQPTIDTYVRQRFQPAVVSQAVNGDWQLDANGWPDNFSAGDVLWWPLTDIIDGAEFNQITATLIGASGHSNPVTPGITMPQIDLYRFAAETNVRTNLATTVDSVTAQASYEAAHSVIILGTAIAVGDRTPDLGLYWYALAITAESGAEYQAGLKALGVAVAQNVSTIQI